MNNFVNHKFRAGAVVRLNSGGPDMVVSQYVALDSSECVCRWPGDEGTMQDVFPQESLTLAISGQPAVSATATDAPTYRGRLCALPTYSFIIGAGGGVQRVADKIGNWIDRASAQAIVDDAEDQLITLRARIATLEAELEAVGAGGVQQLAQAPIMISLTDEQMAAFREELRNVSSMPITMDSADVSLPQDYATTLLPLLTGHAAAPSIPLTPQEIQSGSTRVDWAEGLIKQLPADHDGRNSWLLNYGSDAEARKAEWAQRLAAAPIIINNPSAEDLTALREALLKAPAMPITLVSSSPDVSLPAKPITWPANVSWPGPADDFPLGKACDLSGEGNCEACQ